MNAITERETALPSVETRKDPMVELIAALAKAQGEFKPIEKNREVTIKPKDKPSYTFRYADLEEILAKTRPALSANGLALIQTIEHREKTPWLVCRLMHSAGGVISSEIELAYFADPKAFGAYVSYFRRYLVVPILGVAADDDLDEDGQETDHTQAGETNKGKPAVAEPKRRAPEQQPITQEQGCTSAPNTSTNASSNGAPATTGEIAYISKKITGKGLTIAQARDLAGLDASESLEGLTKDGFTALKDALA